MPSKTSRKESLVNYNGCNIESIKNDNKSRLKFPYEIEVVEQVTNTNLLKDFSGERSYFVQVGPQKWFFPGKYEKEAENLYNFEPRKDDVWVVTFPRSGTTWTQEMVWLIANDMDFKKAAAIPLIERFPFLEFDVFFHETIVEEFVKENHYSKENIEVIENLSKPAWQRLQLSKEQRFIKTHLPFCLLPPNLLKCGCKVIYVARNPKDVAVSFYHLNRLFRTQGYTGTFSKYWSYFQQNLQPWTPYWDHIKEGWHYRNEENILFMFYEDMSKDPRKTIETVSRFLEKTYTCEQINKLENHLKIENFRKNRSINCDVLKDLGILRTGEEGFVRQGQNSGWNAYFSDRLNEEADQWIQINLESTDLRFPK